MEVALDGVTVRYGDVVAIDAVDLAAASGELVVLVGPSGSGKSTALRVLAGLEPPSSGRVLLGGRDVTRDPPPTRGVAMVFQDYALYPHLTARQNLAFGLRVRREPRVTERVDDVAQQLGLTHVMDRYPDQMSGGEQQRVALGRAMVRKPAVYLMDEPLSNLDARLRLSARADIVELHRRLGTTTLYVTHDQAEAMSMADRVVVMDAGRVQQIGTPQDIYDTPANRFVAGFVGSAPMNFAEGGGLFGGPPGSVVGVRPEDLHVSSDGDIEVTVAVVENLGSETLVAATTDAGDRITLRTPPRVPHRPGEPLRLAVDPARRHFFAASGERLS
jgi:ABC-type sugar transport system ATPase subunit